MVMNEKTGLSKGVKKAIIGAIIAVVVIGLGVGAFMVWKSGIFDTKMKLTIAEGTVNLEDSKGNITSAKSNMDFKSGDTISTSYDGTACVTIDNTKKVWVEGYSRVEFDKKGTNIEVYVNKGGLFFEVSDHLGEDEKYRIKTDDLTVNLTRGTSGYISYDPTGLEYIVLTDGMATITAKNPVTGQSKSAEIRGGQKIDVYLYSQKSTSRDSVEFITGNVRPKTLPEFALRVIAKNPALLTNICQYNSWDESEMQYYIDHLPGMNKEE